MSSCPQLEGAHRTRHGAADPPAVAGCAGAGVAPLAAPPFALRLAAGAELCCENTLLGQSHCNTAAEILYACCVRVRVLACGVRVRVPFKITSRVLRRRRAITMSF